MKRLLALLDYHWRHWIWWHYIGYPAAYRLHNRPWRLDKESRHIMYERWDAEWAAKEPQRPRLENK